MKPSPILITVDSNEKGSERAKALALACGGDPAYDLQGFAELPVDMRLECIDKGIEIPGCEYTIGGPMYAPRLCNVELKEIPDFWASKSSGHLGQQILEMVAQGQPGFVAVFGSLQEVLRAVPTQKALQNPSGCRKSQTRSQMDIQNDISTARAFAADATACGVPVFFLCRDHLQAFPWVLSLAKNILTGPNMSSWLPRFPAEPRGYQVLCSISGIGHESALALLKTYGGIAQISSEARLNPLGLSGCRVNGKALGKAKAAKIAEVLG